MEAEELEHLEELGKKQLELFDEIRTESERACVIVGAANIDALLDDLITKALLPVKAKSRLCSESNAFTTFSAKLNLAHQLGLIDDDLFFQVNLLRKIRNDFSHNLSGCRLTEAPHLNRYQDLLKSISKCPLYKRMPKGFPDGNIDEPEHVLTMKLMIVYLSSIILSLIYFVEPVYNENLDNIKQMRESSASNGQQG